MVNHILRKNIFSISTALLLGITGCSNSSSDDGTTASTSAAVSGIGIDGILMDAQVCIDADKSGTCDAGEKTTQTDAEGKFTFAAGSPTGPLILSGGVDKSTGETFKGLLKAPAGSNVVTPLTSAIQSLVDANKSVAEAEAIVKTAMGLSDVTVNLTEFDPYNGISGADAADAQKILAKQTQLQILVHTASATIAGADASTNVNDAMSNVFDALVGSMDTGAQVTLDAQTVARATRQAAAQTYKDASDKNVLIVAIGDVNSSIFTQAVTAANSAEVAISAGAAGDAIGVLDGAINSVAKTGGSADTAAADTSTNKANLSGKTSADLAATVAAREVEDTAAQDRVLAEAKAAEAKLVAQKALEDAQTQAEQEAAARLDAEAKAAAKLAAEKAVAEAQAAKEKAIAEQAAALITQTEADTATALAQAQENAAQAEADSAAAEQIDAETRADDIKDADEATAETLAATALINAYKEIANSAADEASQDVISIELIKTDGYSVDANLTTAQDANSSAHTLADTLTAYTDTNSTYALGLKDDVLAQAKIASDALSDAEQTQSLAISTANISDGIRDRITIILADINSTKVSAQNLFDLNVTDLKSQVVDQVGQINTFAAQYSDINDTLQEANDAAAIAFQAYEDSNTSLVSILQANTDVNVALADLNETKAITAQEEASSEKAKILEYIAQSQTQADLIAKYLQDAEDMYTQYSSVEGHSSNVADAVTTLDSFDPTQSSLTDTLASIKDTLGTQNQDELVLSAIIDIVDVVNSDGVQNLLETNSSLPNLDALTGDVNVMVDIATNATSLGGTDVMHTLAVKLIDASNVLETAFTNSDKVMSYGDINITANQALIIRAGALSAAAALDLAASYSYGDITLARQKTATINGVEYDYSVVDFDPLTLFTQSDFFEMQNTSRLADAGANLKKAATLFASLDATYAASEDINTSDAVKLVAAFNGDGLFAQQGSVKAINVNKLFSSSDYIDRNDMLIPTSYVGYSSNVIAEYEKAADYYDTVKAFDENGSCSNGDAFPSSDINWTVIENAERNTSVTLDENLSIMNQDSIYHSSRPYNFDYYNAQNNCQFYGWNDSDYGRAEFDVTPKDSANNVIIPMKLVDEFVSGATFFTHFNDGDDIYMKVELTSDTEVNTKVSVYYPDENGTIVSATNTYTGTYSVDANDKVTVSVSNDADAGDKSTYYFVSQDIWDDGFSLNVEVDNAQDGTIDSSYTNDYDFSKPYWYPADF